MKFAKKSGRRRRLLTGGTLLGLVAVVAMSATLTAQALPPPPLVASYTGHTGTITPSAGTIPSAVNTADDGLFVQMAPGATITLAFPAGKYAAPDGTATPDITVHTFDTLYEADATVQVYVMSNNGWTSLGMIPDDQGDVGLNLETAGIINQVMLVQNGYIDPDYPTLGFDLDAITASNYITLTTDCTGVTPGTYTGWEFLSTTFVPSTSQAGVSGPTFGDGVAYKVESQGIWQFGSNLGWLADAEWSVGYAGPTWVKDLVGFTPGVLDLMINSDSTIDWGAYSSAHLYTTNLIGDGSPASFLLGVSEDQPNYYNDNTGGLCASVFKDELAPVVSNVAYSANPVAVNAPLTVTANVDDTTANGSDIKSAQFRFDAGSWVAMAATDGTFDEVSEDVTKTTTAPSTPGLYDVCVRGTDAADNQSDGTDCTALQLVVYDPSAGFVTGGGWINSPAGAYKADLTLSGRGNFGFVSKYQKGATVPDGNTEFQFQTGNLNFHSTSYDWLVVNQNGTNAQFKGIGTINGAGNYGFMIWATDASPDTFRIQIWDKDNANAIVYDNGVQQAIAGGSIVVHIK